MIVSINILVWNVIQFINLNIMHGLCYYCLLKKLKLYDPHIALIFPLAACSYSDKPFSDLFGVLASMSLGGAYKHLLDIEFERWA